MTNMTDQQARVNKLIERIERHQATLKLSDKRFVARFQDYLGSTKTWRERLIPRNWDELKNIDKWDQNLNRLVTLIDGGQEIGNFFESMPIAQYVTMMYDQLQGQTNDRRVSFVIGPTGIGKSWVMKNLAIQNPRESAYIYANECWEESMPQTAKGLAEVVGASINKSSGRDTFSHVTQVLRAMPLTLMIDDFQKAGVLGLKLIKSLVDATSAKFILGIYPQSWNKLIYGSTDAYSEAQQILGRTIKPINTNWKDGIRHEDITAYMTAAGVSGDCVTVSHRIKQIIQKNGNLRLLADAVSMASLNSSEQNIPFDAALVEAVVYEFCPQEKRK